MDLIKQFPDISMKVREKFRLQQKLYPHKNSKFLPSYETDKYLINADSNKYRKWTKLILTLLIGLAVVYIIILTVPEFFKWTSQ